MATKDQIDDWMEMEGEDPLAPWMEPGYSAAVPTSENVRYVNGFTYIQMGVDFLFHPNPEEEEEVEEIIEAPSPPPFYIGKPGFKRSPEGNLRKVLGTAPTGDVGSDIWLLPFASIPVRQDDESTVPQLFEYVEAMGNRAGLPFMRIELQDGFPSKSDYTTKEMEVWWQGVLRRWHEEHDAFNESPPDAPRFSSPSLTYINAYTVNRAYGGSEEGGWWYNTGKAIASVPIPVNVPETHSSDWYDAPNTPEEENARVYLETTIGWHSQYPVDSVLGADTFKIDRQRQFARDYPESRPFYS